MATKITGRLAKLVVANTETAFQIFKSLVMTGLAELDVDENSLFTWDVLTVLFNRMDEKQPFDDTLSYRWANFVADNYTANYTDMLLKINDKGRINPRVLAILLRNGADINAVDKCTEKTFYQELVEYYIDKRENSTDDLRGRLDVLQAEVNFRMAYHVQQGSRQAFDKLIKEHLLKCKKVIVEEEQKLGEKAENNQQSIETPKNCSLVKINYENT